MQRLQVLGIEDDGNLAVCAIGCRAFKNYRIVADSFDPVDGHKTLFDEVWPAERNTPEEVYGLYESLFPSATPADPPPADPSL